MKRWKKQKNIFEIIGFGFEQWWKNFVIVLPFIFNAVASTITLIVLFLIFSSIFVASFPQAEMLKNLVIAKTFEATDIETLNSIFTPGVLAYFALAVIISVIVLALVKAYFYAGAIAMASEICTMGKTKLSTMTKGSKFFLRYFLIEFILGIALLLWLFIFSLPFILSKNISLIVIPFVSILPLVFLYVLFLLPTYFLVLNDLNVWQAFAKSIEVVKKNYWTTFGLALIFLLMFVLENMVRIIPFVGFIGLLVSLLVIEPVRTIAFTIFAIER